MKKVVYKFFITFFAHLPRYLWRNSPTRVGILALDNRHVTIYSFRFRNMDQEEKMAACFFFVISSFLLLSIPDLVLHSLDVVIGGDPEWYGMFQWLQRFTQPLFCVIFAINPFIYYFMCSYFRTYVRAVLARLRLIPTNSITWKAHNCPLVLLETSIYEKTVLHHH